MTSQWRKSSRSGGVSDQACVEVVRLSRVSWLRDSENSRPGQCAPARTGSAVPAQSERGDLDR
jgi:hypothetical protein